MSDGERKSVELIAARACGDPHGTKRSQDRLLHFLGQSPWSDQVGVSLSVASRTEHVPIDFALYLPKTWLDSPLRRREARIPSETTLKTKPELALDTVTVRALDDKLSSGIVLADAAYGTSVEFRNGFVAYGLDYAVGINGTSKVWTLDARGRRSADSVSAADLGVRLGRKAFRHVTWRDGTRGANVLEVLLPPGRRGSR